MLHQTQTLRLQSAPAQRLQQLRQPLRAEHKAELPAPAQESPRRGANIRERAARLGAGIPPRRIGWQRAAVRGKIRRVCDHEVEAPRRRQLPFIAQVGPQAGDLLREAVLLRVAPREVSGVRLQLHVRHPQRRLAREQQQAQQPDPRAEVAHARPTPQLRERAEQERVRPRAEGRLVIDIPHPARPEPVRFLHRAPSSARFFLPLYDNTARGARKKHRSGQAPVLFQHAM